MCNYISEEQLIKNMNQSRQCPQDVSEVDKEVFKEARKHYRKNRGLMHVKMEGYKP